MKRFHYNLLWLSLVFLFIVLFLISCLPWQSSREAPMDNENIEKNELRAPAQKQSVKKSSQQPFEPSKIKRQFPIEVTATITHPATILGRHGFSPSELTIEAGDSVTWTNADPQEKIIVLTFQKIGTREFITSISILPGKEWDYVFTSPGEYTYWTVQYGTKGRLMVKRLE